MRTTDRRSGLGAELARAAVALGIVLGVTSCTTTSGGGAAAPAARTPVTAEATTVKYKNGGNPNSDDPYRLVITFADGCPVSAVQPDLVNCPGDRKDCVRMKGGQSVRFESTDAFVLEFDPFGEAKIESTAGGGPIQHVVLKQAGMHGHDQGKPYTFIVRAKSGCKDDKPLDPQIILD